MTSRSERFSVLDVLALVVAIIASLFLITAPFTVAPSYMAMYEEFGGSLPRVTRLALTSWGPPLFAVPAIVCSALALRSDVVRRRVLLTLGALAAVIAIVAFLAAVYMPIYELADNIAAE